MKYINLEKYLALPEEERKEYGIRAKCEKCGKEIKRQTYNLYLSYKLCDRCGGSHFRSTTCIYTTEPIIITNKNKKEIFLHKNGFSKFQKFSFTCEKCNRPVIVNQTSLTKLLCGSCKAKCVFLEKYGVENPGQSPLVREKVRQTCFKKFGTEHAFQANAVKDKIKETCLKRYGSEQYLTTKDKKEKSKQTSLKKYGVEYPQQSKEVQEKIKQTNIERYGVENVYQAEEIKQKIKQTLKDRYNVTTPLLYNKFKEKRKQTCLEKYGVEHQSQSLEIKEKKRQTYLKLFDVEHLAQAEEIKNKIKQTNIKRYGGQTPMASLEVRNKVRKTNIDKYDTTCPFTLDTVKEKSKQTCLKRYGVEYYTQSKEYFKHARKLYIYNEEKFDSSWELYYWIWALETGHNIMHEPVKFGYEVEGKKHYYFPDFEIDGQLVEIKGPQFFKDGKMINPFDSTLNDLFEAKYQCGLQHGVKFITDISEAKEYVDSKYTFDFVDLFRTNLKFPYPNVNLIDMSDRGLIQYFHKSIWDARVRNNPSPKEAWNDKKLIYKVALNRLKYVGSCKPEDILRGFSVTKKAPKVSVFKPTRAKKIIESYASEYATIFDPFSGFSGRMLGAIRNDKNYIGQDLSEEHIEESKALLQWIKDNQGLEVNVELNVQDILTDKERIFEDTCLFTCSPYGSKETWTEGEIQMSCDEWIDVCLKKYKCDRYIFVVDETEKYKDYIVETLENKSHFGSNNEYILVI